MSPRGLPAYVAPVGERASRRASHERSADAGAATAGNSLNAVSWRGCLACGRRGPAAEFRPSLAPRAPPPWTPPRWRWCPSLGEVDDRRRSRPSLPARPPAPDQRGRSVLSGGSAQDPTLAVSAREEQQHACSTSGSTRAGRALHAATAIVERLLIGAAAAGTRRAPRDDRCRARPQQGRIACK